MEENIMLNASFLPTKNLVKPAKNLKENEAIVKGDCTSPCKQLVAFITGVFPLNEKIL